MLVAVGPDMTSHPDPLTSAQRAAIMAAPRPRRNLPLVGASAAARLPLATAARGIDRSLRPNYAVWELTLACDLSCRHCGSRAGQPRRDELTTAEAVDLINQLRDLGVQEIALIGGEAYLHTGWLAVIAEIRRCGMQCTLVTGGRGMTSDRALAAASAGVQSVAVSIDGAEATHDRLRAVTGSYAAAVEALHHCRAAGIPIAVNTQINRLSKPDLPAVFEVLVREGAHGWQLQLTVPAGRAADEPEVDSPALRSLDSLPTPRRVETALRQGGHHDAGRQQRRLLRALRTLAPQLLPERVPPIVQRWGFVDRNRVEWRHQRLPVASERRVGGRKHPRSPSARHLGAIGASASHARPCAHGALGILRRVLLRRRMPGRVHVDDDRIVRRSRQQSLLPPPYARNAPRRASGSESSSRSVRPGCLWTMLDGGSSSRMTTSRRPIPHRCHNPRSESPRWMTSSCAARAPAIFVATRRVARFAAPLFRPRPSPRPPALPRPVRRAPGSTRFMRPSPQGSRQRRADRIRPRRHPRTPPSIAPLAMDRTPTRAGTQRQGRTRLLWQKPPRMRLQLETPVEMRPWTRTTRRTRTCATGARSRFPTDASFLGHCDGVKV